MAGLKFDITGDNENMLSALRGVQDGVKHTKKFVEDSGHSLEQFFEKGAEAVSRHSEALKSDIEAQDLAKQSYKELKESLKFYEKGIKEIQSEIDKTDYGDKIKKATEEINQYEKKLKTYKDAYSKQAKMDDGLVLGVQNYRVVISSVQEKINSLTLSIENWRRKQNALTSDMERYVMLTDATKAKLNVGGGSDSSQKQSLSDLESQLETSRLKLRQLTEEVAKLEGLQVLSDSQKTKLIDVRAEVEKTKDSIKSLNEQIKEQRGGTFFGSVRNAIDGFGEKITDVKDKIKDFISEHTKLNEIKEKIGNNSGIQKFKAEYTQARGVVSDFSQRVENLLTGNGKLQQSFSAIGTAISGMGLPLKGVGSGIANVTKALWAMCATPIGAVITVIVMGLASMYKYLTKSAEGQKTFAQISAFLGSLLSSITDIVVTFGKFLFHAFSDASGSMHGFAKGLATTFTTAVKAAGELIGGLGTALKGIFKMDWNTFSDGMSKIWSGIKDGGKTALSAIDTAFKGAMGSVKLVYSAFTDKDLGKGLGASFDGIISKATKSADLAKRTTEATIAASEAQKRAAELDIQIAENREKIYKLTGKAKDALIEETKILQKQRYNSILDAQRKQLDIQREKNRLHTASLEDLAKERQLHIDVLRTTAEQASSTRMLARMEEANKKKMESSAKSARKKDVSSSNAINAANEKFDEVAYTNANEREKILLDLESKLIDARIAAMEYGAERISAEKDRQNKKELEDIEKQRKAVLEAERKRQKDEFDAEQAIVKAHGGKISTWSNEMFVENKDVKKINSLFDSLKEESNKKFVKERLEEQFKDLNNYLKEYGSFEEKRLAITQEYEEKIRKAGTVGEKATLEADLRKALSALDMKAMQESIDWEDVFRDMDKHSTAYLNNIKKKLRASLSAKEITAENAKVLSEKIRDIENTIGSRTNIWSSMLPGLRERLRLTKESVMAEEAAAKARRESVDADLNVLRIKEEILNNLRGSGVSVNIEDVTAKNKDRLMASVSEGSSLYNALLKLFENLATDTSRANVARENVGKAETRKASVLDKLGSLSKITDVIPWAAKGASFGQIIESVSANVQSMSDLVDTIGLGNSEFGEAVHNFADGVGNFSGAISSLANGDVFGAVNGVVKGFQSFGRVLGIGGGNAERVTKSIDRLTERNELLGQSIDDLSDEMAKSRGAAAIKVSTDADKLLRERIENYKRIAQEQASYHSAHKSFSRYWEGYNDEQKRRLSEQIGRQWNGDIWNLSPEEMKMLRQNVDMWEKIEKTGKGGYGARVAEKLNDYIAQSGKLQENTEALYEILTTTTKDNIFDDFLDSLHRLADGSEDVFDKITDNWHHMVNKMVVNNLVGAKFQKDLEGWYNKLAELNRGRTDGKISSVKYKASLDELKKEYDKYVHTAQDEIEQLRAAGIVSSRTNAEQKATANGISSITYEQAANIVALTTAGNISRDQIKDLVASVMASFSSTIALSSSTNTAVLEIRNLMIYNNSYLEDILKCSKNIYADFSRKIDDVNKNLKDLK